MAQLTTIEFKTQTIALFPTNGIGAISAADLRLQLDNVADSLMFKSIGHTSAPTANDDAVDTAGNGIFGASDIWIDETNDLVYVCVDSTATAAIWKDITQVGGGATTASVISAPISRTLLLTDAENIIETNTTSGVSVLFTIPTNASTAFPIGTRISFTLTDAYSGIPIEPVTSFKIIGGAGVTLNGVSTGEATITTTNFSIVSLYKSGTDAWIISGDISGAIV